jgi:hypothetical protein
MGGAASALAIGVGWAVGAQACDPATAYTATGIKSDVCAYASDYATACSSGTSICAAGVLAGLVAAKSYFGTVNQANRYLLILGSPSSSGGTYDLTQDFSATPTNTVVIGGTTTTVTGASPESSLIWFDTKIVTSAGTFATSPISPISDDLNGIGCANGDPFTGSTSHSHGCLIISGNSNSASNTLIKVAQDPDEIFGINVSHLEVANVTFERYWKMRSPVLS